MERSIQWAELDLGVTVIAGVGVALRPLDATTDRLALPLLGRRVWELCCRAPLGVSGVDEVSASNVELLLQTRRVDLEALLDEIGDRLGPSPPRTTQRFRLPVCFELGTDWDFVVRHTGCARERMIAGLLANTYTLGMFGFLPGFAYLLGLPAELHCPRKASPVPRIEAGSVALGGEYLGVYGHASPAGWQSIGRTPLVMGTLRQVPPLWMEVGDTLVIERIDRHDFDDLAGRSLLEFREGEGDRAP